MTFDLDIWHAGSCDII